MELQQARIRGVAHCIIPQEFTIKNPIIPLPALQQLLPVVVGQSPAVQLSGGPAVVQVLVPSNQVLPNQIPVLVPSVIQHTPTSTEAQVPAVEAVAVTTQEPLTVVEAKPVSSYIFESTTIKPTVPYPTSTTPTTTTTTSSTTPVPTIVIEETTDLEMAPEEIPELDVKEVEEKELHVAHADPVPNSSRMHYSADPLIEDEELLSNGIFGVSGPEVIMPPVGESSHLKLVMPPEEDPPEMLHDQEMPPPTLSVDDVV